MWLAFVIVLGIVSVFFYVIRYRKLGCWLLVLSPAALSVAGLNELSRGVQQLGETAIEDDRKQLIFCFTILFLSLIAALRPKWWWLFGIAWCLNTLVVMILFYLTFFWKAFSG